MERRVFTLLWTFADPQGCNARPGRETLADCLSTESRRTHVRTVRNAVARLEELGYIALTAPAVRRNKVAKTYRVQVPPNLPTDAKFLGREALRPKDDSFTARSENFTAQSGQVLGRDTDTFMASLGAPLEVREVKIGGGEARDGSAATPTTLAPAAQKTGQPSPCRKHPDGNADEPCFACKAVREWQEACQAEAKWSALEARRVALIPSCGLCDDAGYCDTAYVAPDPHNLPEHFDAMLYPSYGQPLPAASMRGFGEFQHPGGCGVSWLQPKCWHRAFTEDDGVKNWSGAVHFRGYEHFDVRVLIEARGDRTEARGLAARERRERQRQAEAASEARTTELKAQQAEAEAADQDEAEACRYCDADGLLTEGPDTDELATWMRDPDDWEDESKHFPLECPHDFERLGKTLFQLAEDYRLPNPPNDWTALRDIFDPGWRNCHLCDQPTNADGECNNCDQATSENHETITSDNDETIRYHEKETQG
jgi:hypothetical protein